MSTRYAVYYAPPADHPLWRAGCAWLGRDARAGEPPGAPPPHAGEPWRYGFHATLKPPLRLAPGRGEAELLAELQRLVREHEPFEMPVLRVGTLAGFVALLPAQPLASDHALRRLADDCVQRLDAWRAAPSA